MADTGLRCEESDCRDQQRNEWTLAPFAPHTAELRRLCEMDRPTFEAKIFSCAPGVSKPESEIYWACLDALGLERSKVSGSIKKKYIFQS